MNVLRAMLVSVTNMNDAQVLDQSRLTCSAATPRLGRTRELLYAPPPQPQAAAIDTTNAALPWFTVDAGLWTDAAPRITDSIGGISE